MLDMVSIWYLTVYVWPETSFDDLYDYKENLSLIRKYQVD